MPLIIWTPDLTVGVAKIDDQHKELFKAADNLAEAMWAGKTVLEIGKTIDFLADYTTFHFRDEETLMLQEAYPGYAAQKSAHEKFVTDIAAIKAKFASGEASSAMGVELLTKACDWFRTHIRVMDKALGDYMLMKQHS